MAIQMQATTDLKALRLSQERPAETFSGYIMLLVLLALIAVAAGGATLLDDNFVLAAWLIVPPVILFIFVSVGFYFLQPNQAAAILLFGSYKGTDRTTGLRWRWPWLTRT